MSERRRKFTPEYRAEAVKAVIETSRPIAQVARELGILEGTLGNWVAAYRRDHVDEEPPLAVSERARHHITDAGLEYSIGFSATGPVQTAIETIPEQAWRAALDSDGQPREGAQVAELTAWMPAPVTPTRSPARFGPQEWPPGMRVIARREQPHPGAQLRLTDHNGRRITCFATNTRGPGWTLPALEIRHRLRARAEDRIRGLKDTGLRNLPFHGYTHNQIWVEM